MVVPREPICKQVKRQNGLFMQAQACTHLTLHNEGVASIYLPETLPYSVVRQRTDEQRLFSTFLGYPPKMFRSFFLDFI